MHDGQDENGPKGRDKDNQVLNAVKEDADCGETNESCLCQHVGASVAGCAFVVAVPEVVVVVVAV